MKAWLLAVVVLAFVGLPLATVYADCAACAVAKEKDGWCEGCKVGYIGGEKTSCKSCFDIRTAGRAGWCDDCKVGYAAGMKTKCKSCFAAMQAKEGGWCPDCGVGYAKDAKTKCKDCFAALQKNGTCAGCGVRFQDGRAFKQCQLHVHGLVSDKEVSAVKAILAKQKGVTSVAVDRKICKVDFDLEATDGTQLVSVIHALEDAGFHSHQWAALSKFSADSRVNF